MVREDFSEKVYSFITATVTNEHAFSGLKQYKFILTVLEVSSLITRVGGCVLSLPAWGNVFP